MGQLKSLVKLVVIIAACLGLGMAVLGTLDWWHEKLTASPAVIEQPPPRPPTITLEAPGHEPTTLTLPPASAIDRKNNGEVTITIRGAGSGK